MQKGEKMDKLISLQQAFDALHCRFADGFEEDRWWNSTHVIAALKGLPAVQPDIIRCKDCKYWTHIKRTNRYWCKTDDGLFDLNPSPDDFCSRGERRTDGQTDFTASCD